MYKKCAYVSRKGKQMFIGLRERMTYVKMKKTEEEKSLVSSWEGPFLFVKYAQMVMWQTFLWVVPLGTTLPKSQESSTQFKIKKFHLFIHWFI